MISIASALTNYYRADLSDNFNNSNLNSTLWNTTVSAGTSGFCFSGGAAANYWQTETTSYEQKSAFTGVSGSDACFVYQNTFGYYNYKNLSVFKQYDIYLNTTNTLISSGSNPSDRNASFSIYSSVTGTKIVDLMTFTNSTTSSIWHLRINRALQTISAYNQDGSLNNTADVSAYSNWYIGWYDSVKGSATNAGGMSTKIYNYSVYESDIAAAESSVTYNSNVYGTTSQTFTSSLYWDNSTYSNIITKLYYDGVLYPVTVTKNGNTATSTITLDTPSVSSITNKNFNFIYYLDSQTVNGSNYIQTINPTILALCNATINVPYINFTTKEEGSQVEMNASIATNFVYWLGAGVTYNTFSYADTNNNQSRFNFCFSPSNTPFTTTALIEYNYVNPVTNETWSLRQYYLDNAVLTNVTNSIDLYLLTANSTSPVTFTVVDENYHPVINAYIRIMRWNIATDQFYTAIIVKTGPDGKAVANIRLNDAWYMYQVLFNGNVLISTTPAIETQQARTIQVTIATPSTYTLFNNLSYSFIFNNVTKTFIFNYADTTGKVARGCLKVSGLLNSTIYYNLCLDSTSGNLAYSLTDNSTYVGEAQFYLTSNYSNQFQTVKRIIIGGTKPERFSKIGNFGIIPAILLIGTLAMIGIAMGSIVAASLLTIAGIVVSNLFGLVYFSPVVMYSLIALALVIAFMSRRKFT